MGISSILTALQTVQISPFSNFRFGRQFGYLARIPLMLLCLGFPTGTGAPVRFVVPADFHRICRFTGKRVAVRVVQIRDIIFVYPIGNSARKIFGQIGEDDLKNDLSRIGLPNAALQ